MPIGTGPLLWGLMAGRHTYMARRRLEASAPVAASTLVHVMPTGRLVSKLRAPLLSDIK